MRKLIWTTVFRRHGEKSASVMAETLEYVQRLVLGTAYEKREVVRREQLLSSGLPGHQLELR